MSSFINDNKGMIEPYADLTAMALAVVGFIVFIAIIAQSYMTFQEKTFIAEHFHDAVALAEKLSRDKVLTGRSPDIIDSMKIEELSKDPEEIIKKYGAYYNFMFKIEASSASREYSRVIKDPDVAESKIGISASIPITVRINDVQELPGTLTVKLWRKN